ncbi:hypothetical protein AKJ16_DCAP21976 [Drosera capensis]
MMHVNGDLSPEVKASEANICLNRGLFPSSAEADGNLVAVNSSDGHNDGLDQETNDYKMRFLFWWQMVCLQSQGDVRDIGMCQRFVEHISWGRRRHCHVRDAVALKCERHTEFLLSLKESMVRYLA